MYRFKASFIALVLVCVFSVFVTAEELSEADQRAANAFRLTEKNLTQFGQATRNLIGVLQKNPGLKDIDATEDEDVKGIDSLVKVFDSIPEVKKAVESAGMSSRDYWLFQFAMAYAGAGHMAKKAGMDTPANFSKENIAFFGSHEAEFMKLDKDIKELGKLMEDSPAEEAVEEEPEETEELNR